MFLLLRERKYLAVNFDGVVEKQKSFERSKTLRILSTKYKDHYQKYIGSIVT